MNVLTAPTKQNGLHSNSRPSWAEIYATHSKTLTYQFWFYHAISNTPKMGTESVPETSGKVHTLKRLSALEHFVESRNFELNFCTVLF
jgi:hypothetical protein